MTAKVAKPDLRAGKTRTALMRSFNSNVLSRGYDSALPAEIAEAAGVARSTLYEHFAGKEDMLRHSLLPILEPLADSVGSSTVAPRLQFVLEHIRGSRRMARELLKGRARTVAKRTLAQLIETRLAQLASCRTGVPRKFKAAYLASGILGLLDEWLSGHEACPAAVLARALQASTHAAAVAGNEEACPAWPA
ncbi:MAG TPA: helix-turn-helix domain-containing protein [Chloroflexota bacterium]|nr:helix-turn-helix domain-containing protein [Chloroflexota bacterium]